MIQHCVDPVHETITQLDIQALSTAMTLLVLASRLWLVMDPFQEGGVSMLGQPFAGFHASASPDKGRGQHLVGMGGSGWVHGCLPPAMCVDLARFYLRCVLDAVRDPLLRPSPVSNHSNVEGWPELCMGEVVAAFPVAEEEEEVANEGRDDGEASEAGAAGSGGSGGRRGQSAAL